MANELPEKLPPQSIEAEKSLLGCLMLDKNTIIRVADFLYPKDFYKKIHQEIYSSVLDVFDRGGPIDLLSVANRLKDKSLLDGIGGHGYLTELINSVPTASHAASYAKIIQRKRIFTLPALFVFLRALARPGRNDDNYKRKIRLPQKKPLKADWPVIWALLFQQI